jgi:hypothetical protein
MGGFNLLAVDPVYQDMVIGAIIATAVSIDAWARIPVTPEAGCSSAEWGSHPAGSTRFRPALTARGPY